MIKPLPQVDPVLLERAIRGDMAAHGELYEAFAPTVYTLARRMLVSQSLAEDILQETFIEVIRKIDTYRGEGDFGFWVKRIAINKCLLHLRSSWTSRRAEMPEVETLSADAPAPGFDFGYGGSETGAEGDSTGVGAERNFALEAALNRLSDTARVVVWLHDVEGYTHKEIGRMMRRTASFSKSQLARAHDRLRALLEEAPKENRRQLCTQTLKTC